MVRIIRLIFKVLLCGFMLFFAVNHLSGQGVFNGTLKDSETGEVISNATVVYGDAKGVISDNQGNFEIENPSFPLRLEISHLSYKSKIVIVRSIHENGMIIPLELAKSDLKQIEIVGNKINRFFQERFFYTIDYEFVNDNIIIIGYDQGRLNKGRLLLTNLSQDTLFSLAIDKPKNLFKDAFGNIHLFAGDSAYQISEMNSKIEMIYPTHTSNFSEDLSKLQIADNHQFVFKDIHGDGQLHTYYRIDTITRKVDTLSSAFDRQLFQNERRAGYHKESKLRKLDIDYKGQMDTSAAGMRAANRLFEFTQFNNFVLHNPITSQIFVFDQEYIILDISNSEIHAFTIDSLKPRTILMMIPLHSKRTKYFVQDEINKKIYWVNYVGSKAKLLELDTKSGEVISTLETPNLPFIENIKIRNGVIWFLYQPRLGETVRSLYRMAK